MARKRNKTSEATTNDGVTIGDEVLTHDADIAAIEALLDGDAEVTLDSPEPDAPVVEDDNVVAMEAADDQTLIDEAIAEIEASEAVVVVSDEELSDDIADDIAALDAREGAYADQESEVDIAEAGPSEAKSEGKAEAKADKPKRSVKLPFEDAVKAIHAAEPLCLDSEAGALDDAGIQTLIDGVKQVKVQEKLVNLLHGVLADAKMSVYTTIALDLLKKAYHSGEALTSAQIRKAYEEKGYKSGTVNAQQGQMMVLFSALGMADRVDRATLKPNANSVLLDALCA